MSITSTIKLEEIMASKLGTIDPAKFPEEVFDLYSIPAFDQKQPELVAGSFIGSAKQIVQPGDILLSKIVPHIRRSWVVGKSRGRRLIASSEWIVFRSERVHPDYLRHLLVSDPFHAKFMNTVSGVGGSLLRARPAVVAKIEIPLPPLPEQRRIAAILDKADALREKRRQAIAKLDTLLQSVFLEMFGDPVVNPKGWRVQPLSELLQFRTGKLDSNAMVEGGEYPFFTCSRETYQIDHYAFDCEALLLAGNNANADYSVKHYKGKFNAYQRTYVITLQNPKHSYTYMKNALERKLQEMKMLSKGTNTKYLTLSILQNLKVQVPDEVMQASFEEVASRIDGQREKYEMSLRKIDELFNSLQQRAFSGELFTDKAVAAAQQELFAD